MTVHHVLSFSGGKGSTALYLLAHELRDRIARRGHSIEVVFADTGHEHPLTLDFVRALPGCVADGLPIRWVKAEFAADFARKRAFVAAHWRAAGVPEARVLRALELLAEPTGIPFLDLCMMKGRFPSTKRRFCSEQLKHVPVFEQIQAPVLARGVDVWSWQGVRAEESEARKDLPRMERALTVGKAELVTVRPIHRLTVNEVFAIHRRHGVAPNPLYRMGMGRVGCMPCIHCTKEEIRQIALRFPDQVARLIEWEQLVGEASKRGLSTFFSYDKIPGDHLRDHTLPMPVFRDVIAWASTGRGGRQYDLLFGLEDGQACSSLYGLCE